MPLQPTMTTKLTSMAMAMAMLRTAMTMTMTIAVAAALPVETYSESGLHPTTLRRLRRTRMLPTAPATCMQRHAPHITPLDTPCYDAQQCRPMRRHTVPRHCAPTVSRLHGPRLPPSHTACCMSHVMQAIPRTLLPLLMLLLMLLLLFMLMLMLLLMLLMLLSVMLLMMTMPPP